MRESFPKDTRSRGLNVCSGIQQFSQKLWISLQNRGCARVTGNPDLIPVLVNFLFASGLTTNHPEPENCPFSNVSTLNRVNVLRLEIPMVRKVWIAVLVFALCLHLGVGIAFVYVRLHFPHPFRYLVDWWIIFVFLVLAFADCVALHRRIIDDDGESLCLRL